MKYAVLSLSGGMDSSTLLLNLINDGYIVTAVGFDYGQKHKIELTRSKELVNYLNMETPDWIFINHHIIKINGITELLDSHLVEGGNEVPEGHYEEDIMKQTVVPNRNKIMNSIIQAVALSLSKKHNSEVAIAMGIHAGDHAIYPDCRQEFRDVDFKAFQVGNWDSDKISVITPYLKEDKYDILKDGQRCCDLMGLNFEEIYKRTNTSYKPTEEGYSDYKSASSVERIEAFIKLGKKDPVTYADESGVVSWDKVVNYVSNVLALN